MEIKSLKKVLTEQYLLLVLSVGLFLLAFFMFTSFFAFQNIELFQQSHFTSLATAFLKGRLDIPDKYLDLAFYNEKYYVYFGPMPAILIVPLVALFGKTISQSILAVFLLPLNFFLVYKISRLLKASANTAIWLSIFYVFGTIYLFLSLVNISSYLVEIVGVTFILLALLEFFNRRRFLLIGFFIAAAGLSRITLYLSSFFFLLSIAAESKNSTKKVDFATLSIPIIASLVLYGAYNFARFRSPLETGYSYINTIGTNPILSSSIDKGVFSIKHVPGNLYFLLFKGPEPIRSNNIDWILKYPYLKASDLGMGIFFTSPLFIFIFLSSISNPLVRRAFATILILMVPILTYYGIGGFQYGYRYALDFYPFLVLLLILVFRKGFPPPIRMLIATGVIFNLFYMFSVFDLYPFGLK